MIRLHLILWIIFFANPMCAAVYKWTDSNGNVTFSDKPHEGAQQIELPKIQRFSSPAVPLENNTDDTDDVEVESTKNPYKKLLIVEPQDQVTIRNAQGVVNVKLELTPKLKPSDAIQLLMDNIAFGEPQSATNFTMQGVIRGSHTLTAQVVDKKGRILKTSDSITIFMMPPRINMGKPNT